MPHHDGALEQIVCSLQVAARVGDLGHVAQAVVVDGVRLEYLCVNALGAGIVALDMESVCPGDQLVQRGQLLVGQSVVWCEVAAHALDCVTLDDFGLHPFPQLVLADPVLAERRERPLSHHRFLGAAFVPVIELHELHWPCGGVHACSPRQEASR